MGGLLEKGLGAFKSLFKFLCEWIISFTLLQLLQSTIHPLVTIIDDACSDTLSHCGRDHEILLGPELPNTSEPGESQQRIPPWPTRD